MQKGDFKNYRKIEGHTMKEKIQQILRKYGAWALLAIWQ
jgi:membrane protein YqaA with SNARE-associated domain